MIKLSKELTTKARDGLSSGQFVFPKERRYLEIDQEKTASDFNRFLARVMFKLVGKAARKSGSRKKRKAHKKRRRK